ncbi:uncharacterized protein LOC116298193 [Actinia tenebrosa]|uniref:Uncharacterized protein LOC116298193 n=1 Tax=Actinia tenebrosa TaxID=6105 RepID=A0A6P8I4N9_ACTTE|nr:uncharacterized protein LOC116298193 [Actinia tenebrosa]
MVIAIMHQGMNDATNYEALNVKVQDEVSKEHQLQKLEDRTDKSAYTLDAWKSICFGKYKTRWRGCILMKSPFIIVTYQQLFWDVKPRTVLEFGANSGGSAVWMADTLQMFGCKSHVYSVDIDLGLLEPLAREKRNDLTFLQGDCNEIQKTFPPEMLKSLPHPWFVSEDSHVNVVGVLDYIDQFTEPGDYMAIEDTNPLIPTASGASLFDDVKYEEWGREKLEHVEAFMKKHPTRYLIDKEYTDFFGYNGSEIMNGYLRRI